VSTLADLPIGRKARVTSVEGTDTVSMRLLEMGITPGVEMEAVGTALWGDPLEFEVRGYRLSVRKAEAARVGVELL